MQPRRNAIKCQHPLTHSIYQCVARLHYGLSVQAFSTALHRSLCGSFYCTKKYLSTVTTSSSTGPLGSME